MGILTEKFYYYKKLNVFFLNEDYKTNIWRKLWVEFKVWIDEKLKFVQKIFKLNLKTLFIKVKCKKIIILNFISHKNVKNELLMQNSYLIIYTLSLSVCLRLISSPSLVI